MTDFKKYTSIENHYQEGYVVYYSQFSDLKTETFVASEKLDGANIQVYITADEIKLGRRTTWIDEPFNDIHNVIKKYQKQIDAIQEHCVKNDIKIRLFGELYGEGIQKRIDYGDDKYISFFDIMVNDDYLAFSEFMSYVDKYNLPTPKIYLEGTLDECLALDVEDKGEGVVIKPKNNYYLSSGSRFALKKKSKSFDDIKAKTNKPKGKHPLNDEFRRYINDNRVQDVFSKYGQIENFSQISQYVKYVLDDAKEDFNKDFDIDSLYPDADKEEMKAIFNVGGSIANILKSYINQKNKKEIK